MGLDAVEMLMSVEEKFQISISDEEAQKATTPGKLVDLVLKKITPSKEPGCLTSRAFFLLRRHGMTEFNLPRAAFRPSTALEEIVPKSPRKESWNRLKRAVGAPDWPELRRPRPLLFALTIALIVVTGVCAEVVGRRSGSGSLAFVSAIVAAVFTGWLAAVATRPLKLAFPSGYQHVGDLAHFLIARNPGLFAVEPGTWTRERVWCMVRDIIIEQTGTKDFTEDSHFIKDIHLG